MTEDKIVKERERSLQNLVSLADRTMEERQEIGRIGGIKSGESKRRMKTFKEELKELLAVEMENAKGEKVSVQKNINSALILKASKGDVKAYEVIRDTLGQKPKDEKEVVVKSDEGLKVNLELVKEMEDKFKNESDK